MSEWELVEGTPPVEQEADAWELVEPTASAWEIVEEEEVSTEPEPVELPSALRVLHYGYTSNESDVEYAADLMEANAPSGRLDFSFSEGFNYISPEETYGNDFMELSVEDRRKRIRSVKNAYIQEEFKDVLSAGLEDSKMASVGGVAGMLASPTTLLPVGAVGYSWKAAGMTAGASGIIGGEMALLEQMAKEGVVDWGTVGKQALVASTIGAVPVVGGKLIGAALKKNTDTVVSTMSKKRARTLWDEMRGEQSELWVKAVDELPEEIAQAGTPQLKADAIGRVVSKRYEDVANNEADFLAKAGKDRMPSMTLDTAKHKDRLTGEGFKNGFAKELNYAFGTLHDRVRHISPRLAGGLRHTESEIYRRSGEVSRNVESLDGVFDSMGNKEELWDLLQDGNWAVVESKLTASGNEEGFGVLAGIKKEVEGAWDDLVKTGALDADAHIKNYFPRLPRDRDGLVAAVAKSKGGKVLIGDIDEAIKAAAAKTEGGQLSDLQKAIITNKMLRAPEGKSGRGFTKKRGFDQIPQEYKKFYYEPKAALHAYLRESIDEVETRRFFGITEKGVLAKGATEIDATGKKVKVEVFAEELDLEKSMGFLLKDEVLSNAQETELKSIFNSRFGSGRVGAKGWVASAKELTYMATLANPVSAVTQFGDLGAAMAVNGLTETVLVAAGRTGKFISRKEQKVNIQIHAGLTDASHEMATQKGVSKMLNKGMKWSGFTATDRYGKNVLAESSLNKAAKIFNKDGSINGKNMGELYDKYGEAWGDAKVGELVNDLKGYKKEGKMTNTLGEYIFNEISDLQPISRSELPQGYLDMPNWSAVYMLKTWGIKQVNVMRNRGFNRMRNGDVAGGAIELGKIGAYMGGMNLGATHIKDFLMGRDIDWDASEVGWKFGEEIAQQVFLEKYGASRADGPLDYFASMFMDLPPVQVGDVGARFAWEGTKSIATATATDNLAKTGTKALNYVPIIGKLAVSHFVGGKEKYNEKLSKKKKKNEGRPWYERYER